MSFTQKLITATITPGGGGAGSFGGGGGVPSGTSMLGGPLSLQNLRMSCHVQVVGDKAMGEMTLLVWGMTLAHMNAISTLGIVGLKVNPDMVDVYAGDSNGMSHIFKGTIWQATSDFQGPADVPMRIVSLAGSTESATSIQPTSVNNKSADVAQIMQQLAGQMNLQFENNGVNVKIAYPYLPGSARTQAMELAAHANIDWVIDRGVLAITPRNGTRSGATPLISPQTGMVGYPSWSSIGIKLKTLYNPDLKFLGAVQVQSSVTPANGTWKIQKMHHDLECFKPNGEWFTTIECAKFGSGAIAP